MIEADHTRGPKPKQSRRVREFILGQIRSGLWAPGQVLPAEAELAEQSAVSQPTVHRELRRLISDGTLAEDASGRRLVAGAAASLMARTIVLLSRFDIGQDHGQGLERWASSLDLAVQRQLLAGQWRVFGMHPERLSDANLAQLGGDPPAGVLLMADELPQTVTRRLVQTLRRTAVPLVLVGEVEGGTADAVSSDQAEGGRLVARWLAEQGCRRLIAMHRPESDLPWHEQRQSGHRTGAAEAGLPPPVRCDMAPSADPSIDPASRHAAISSWLADRLRPLCVGGGRIGILGLSDGEVPTLWGACRRLGLEPGRDVMVSGYDGWWQVLEAERRLEPLPPAVSTDRQYAELAPVIVRTLVERIAKPAASPRQVRVAPRLIVHPLPTDQGTRP
jgi:DNA-binding LacI/PurR family transcriptional regulator